MEKRVLQEQGTLDNTLSQLIDDLNGDPMQHPYVCDRAEQIGESNNQALIEKAFQVLSKNADHHAIVQIWKSTSLRKFVFDKCMGLEDSIREALAKELFEYRRTGYSEGFMLVDSISYQITDIIGGLRSEPSLKRMIVEQPFFCDYHPVSALKFAFEIEEYGKAADFALNLFKAAYKPQVNFKKAEMDRMFEGVLKEGDINDAVKAKEGGKWTDNQRRLYHSTCDTLAKIVANKVEFFASKSKNQRKAYSGVADKLVEYTDELIHQSGIHGWPENCFELRKHAVDFYLLAKNYEGFVKLINSLESHSDSHQSLYCNMWISFHLDITSKGRLSKREKEFLNLSERKLTGIIANCPELDSKIAATTELNRYDLLVDVFWKSFGKGDLNEELYSFLSGRNLVGVPGLYSHAIDLFNRQMEYEHLSLAIKVADMTHEIIPAQLILDAIKKSRGMGRFAITAFDYLTRTDQMPERYLPLYQSLSIT